MCIGEATKELGDGGRDYGDDGETKKKEKTREEAEVGQNLTNVAEKAGGGLAGANNGDELDIQRKKWSVQCCGTVSASMAWRRHRGGQGGALGAVLGEGDGGERVHGGIHGGWAVGIVDLDKGR